MPRLSSLRKEHRTCTLAQKYSKNIIVVGQIFLLKEKAKENIVKQVKSVAGRFVENWDVDV